MTKEEKKMDYLFFFYLSVGATLIKISYTNLFLARHSRFILSESQISRQYMKFS